jgi:hypothetical protein
VTQQPRDAIRPVSDRPANPEPAAPSSPSLPAKAAGWNWRLVVFLWITSMLFLGVYEFLCAFLRVVFHPVASP